MMLCVCRRRSRESLHRLSFSMTCISWPVRLCSAADCSSAAATAPARGAVKCVDKKKGRSNGSFSLRPLSSLDSFCVRQSEGLKGLRNGPGPTRRHPPPRLIAWLRTRGFERVTARQLRDTLYECRKAYGVWLLTPIKPIPFFEPYAWSTRDVFHSLPGAAPCIHAT